MKRLLLNLLGLSLLAGFASVATAQVSVTITGSTAARSTVHETLLNSVFDAAPSYAWTGNTTRDKATQSLWKGQIGGVAYVINCSWSGSASGIRDVAQGNTVTIIDPATTTANAYIASPATTTATPKFAMSDVYQSSTAYTSPALINTNAFVVEFVFITNPTGAAAGITNMTPQLFNKIFKSSGTPLSFITGNPADTAKIYGTGRDDGSGTRITTLAETGYGVATAVNQYRLLDDTVNINGFQQWPNTSTGFGAKESLSSNNIVGNGGFNSGGEVARKVSLPSASANIYAPTDNLWANPGSARTIYLVGYVGLADVIPGNTMLTYNAAALTDANVQEGVYTFWSYEHLYDTGSLTAGEQTFKTQLSTGISLNLVSGFVSTPSMHVSRSGDGGSVL